MSLGDIALEKMEQWESLELDKAELQSFMRRCSGSTSLIPGPVRNYQAVIMNLRQEDSSPCSSLWSTLLLQLLLVTLNQMLGNGRPCSSNTTVIYDSNTMLYIYATNLIISFMSDKI